MLAGMADDRRAALRRRLADLRRQLRRGVNGATLDVLAAEGIAAQAELAALGSSRQNRARRPWGCPPPSRMRVKTAAHRMARRRLALGGLANVIPAGGKWWLRYAMWPSRALNGRCLWGSQTCRGRLTWTVNFGPTWRARPISSGNAWENEMRRYEKIALICFLIASVLVACVIFWELYYRLPVGRLISTDGYILAVSGLIQLEISGLFEKIMDEYGNEERYPYGPPSRIVREIIDNPDRPIRTRIRNVLFFRLRTGFELILVGTILQAIGMWL
jgi:hypothetical protein